MSSSPDASLARFELTASEAEQQASFAAFVAEEITPYAEDFEAAASVPPELCRLLAERGYLASFVPEASGERATRWWSMACSKPPSRAARPRSRASPPCMEWWPSPCCAGALLRSKSASSPLARGDILGAFALTEPEAGSDIQAIEATARVDGDTFVLTGQKRWVSFGQIADLFLVFARAEEGPTAFSSPGTPRGSPSARAR